MQIKALLIGCGNIGAGYDLNSSVKVWTHAKAFSLHKNIELSVFDQDTNRAREIAAIYKANLIEKVPFENFHEFDIISITTPTPTHFLYLEKALSQNVPVIICEKPVVNSIEQIEKLAELYKNSNSKVLVNYIRRFQPAFFNAREKIKEIKSLSSLTGIIIKYNRGFLNNGSHAFDLLEFLFDEPVAFKDIYKASIAFDAFEYDPTITGDCSYMEHIISFVGLTNTKYPIFEIELFFNDFKLIISNSGNEIQYFYLVDGKLQEKTDERQLNILDTYMVPVIEEAINHLNNKDSEDNFDSSLQLNKRILQIIEPLN